ncbi:hypothetical protein [Pedobacter sp. SYP-B3415]|uniref:hypothetical protein n=1 Tax=Pedobacter sp. SYP-B3415 TaxID=2496641 RepID=UPI00101C3B6B|nr:hypothetical protein [Pedobacter sp. SYP-B3415]
MEQAENTQENFAGSGGQSPGPISSEDGNSRPASEGGQPDAMPAAATGETGTESSDQTDAGTSQTDDIPPDATIYGGRDELDINPDGPEPD